MLKTESSKPIPFLAAARRRWGIAEVITGEDEPRPARRGLVVAFRVGGDRISRVAEQVRDVSNHRIDRRPTR